MEDVKQYKYATTNNKEIDIFYVTPEMIDEETRIIFVMHGCLRNAEDYIEKWKELTNENMVVIFPKFSEDAFMEVEYNYGNVNSGYGINDENEWTFEEVDMIFLDFIIKLRLNIKKYILYGHSAGAQFVHRYMLLNESLCLDFAISANAGCYTVLSEEHKFPYGISDLVANKERMLRNLQKRFYVMVGSKYIDPNHAHFPQDRTFDFEGTNRYERGHSFYNYACKYARENKIKHKWHFVIMKNVSHNNEDTIPYVIEILRDTK